MARQRFYTAQEAIRKLGLAKSTFYDYVKEGRIPKPQLPPYRQRGALFPANEIDDMADAMRGFRQQYSEDKKRYIFRPAYIEDAQAMHKFGQRIFALSGGYGPPIEMLVEWFKNPYTEVGHVLLDNDQIVGYFTLLPLSHEKIMRIMRREIRPREIKTEDLEALEPGNPMDFFVAEMAVDPNKKQLGAYLLRKMLMFFNTLGKGGIEIEGIYATASSLEGINLCRKVGMKQMQLSNIQPNWIPFEMKVQETKSRLVKDYIQALRRYKRRHQKKT